MTKGSGQAEGGEGEAAHPGKGDCSWEQGRDSLPSTRVTESESDLTPCSMGSFTVLSEWFLRFFQSSVAWGMLVSIFLCLQMAKRN